MTEYGRREFEGELKALWKSTFGDSDWYIDSFFKKVRSDENTLVYTEGGRVLSALYIIPYGIFIEGKKETAAYLYALATQPEFRGRGIMSELINSALDLSRERGYAISALIPADVSLAGFYRKFGFEYFFEQVKITKTRKEAEKLAQNSRPARLYEADAGQIWRAYSRSVFVSHEHIVLSEEQNEFYVDTLKNDGGEALIVKSGTKEHYALLKFDGGNLLIYETDVDFQTLKPLCAALIEKYDFESVTFCQPVCFGKEETDAYKKPFAMAKKLKEISLKDPFLNRVLM